MSPIIGARGGLSASAYGLFTASAAIAGDYQSIATVTVGSGGSSSISFSSIVGTFKHLQIRIHAKSSTSGDYDWSLRFNSDTGTNYTKHQVAGDGSTTFATGTASQNQIPGGFLTNGAWSSSIADVLDYTSTSKNKTVRVLTGSDNNGDGLVGLRSGMYFATPAAITSIQIIPTSGASGFAEYTSFALYGIKG